MLFSSKFKYKALKNERKVFFFCVPDKRAPNLAIDDSIFFSNKNTKTQFNT